MAKLLYERSGADQQLLSQLTQLIHSVTGSVSIFLLPADEMGMEKRDRQQLNFLIVHHRRESREHELVDRIVNLAKAFTPAEILCLLFYPEQVQEGISRKQFLFTNMLSRAIVLRDDQFVVAKTMEIDWDEFRRAAAKYYQEWHAKGAEFLIDATNAYDRGNLSLTLFYLHQSVESFYSAVALTFGGYRPRTHSLEKLRQLVRLFSSEVAALFANDTAFRLLKDSYVDARYRESFAADKQLVCYLVMETTRLGDLTKTVCVRRFPEIVSSA